jgi:hypothetical protein
VVLELSSCPSWLRGLLAMRTCIIEEKLLEKHKIMQNKEI